LPAEPPRLEEALRREEALRMEEALRKADSLRLEEEAPLDLADLLGIQIALELVEAESMQTEVQQIVEVEDLQALQRIAAVIQRLASECALSRKASVGNSYVM